jgi:hypothetical protein
LAGLKSFGHHRPPTCRNPHVPPKYSPFTISPGTQNRLSYKPGGIAPRREGAVRPAMRYFALACDYDGTLADAGVVSPSTLDALQRLKDSGRKPILVTGRQLDDLFQVFPEHAIFDRILADNGAVLYSPASRETKTLGEPPPAAFLDALRLRGVPFSAGKVIVATVEPYDVAVLEAIKEQGLELQVVYNKGSVMVLPSGLNKSTGLAAALGELGLSEHNTVAVGDGENDNALLAFCELGVAVSDAIPTLKDRADLTTTLPASRGVKELIDRILANDLAGVEPPRSSNRAWQAHRHCCRCHLHHQSLRFGPGDCWSIEQRKDHRRPNPHRKPGEE